MAFVLSRPIHWSIDGRGLSRLACRSPEKIADVHRGIGASGVPRSSLGDCVTATTRGQAVPESASVAYPFEGRCRQVQSAKCKMQVDNTVVVVVRAEERVRSAPC